MALSRNCVFCPILFVKLSHYQEYSPEKVYCTVVSSQMHSCNIQQLRWLSPKFTAPYHSTKILLYMSKCMLPPETVYGTAESRKMHSCKFQRLCWVCPSSTAPYDSTKLFLCMATPSSLWDALIIFFSAGSSLAVSYCTLFKCFARKVVPTVSAL